MDWLSRELISRQADLQDERQLLEKLLLSIDVGVAYVDKDEIYQIVNPQYATYYGRQPEDFLGKRLFSLIPELENPYREILDAALNSRRSVTARRVAASYEGGGIKYKDCTFTPIINEDGEVTGTIVLSMDVTETVKQEEQLYRQAAIVDGSLDAIIATDLDGTIQTWNQSAERIYGLTAPEAIGQSIAITVPTDRQGEVPRNAVVLTTGKKAGFSITERIRKGGEIFQAAVSISPVRDGNNKIVGAAAIVRDLSEELTDFKAI